MTEHKQYNKSSIFAGFLAMIFIVGVVIGSTTFKASAEPADAACQVQLQELMKQIELAEANVPVDNYILRINDLIAESDRLTLDLARQQETIERQQETIKRLRKKIRNDRG